jgi:hypothetical protein
MVDGTHQTASAAPSNSSGNCDFLVARASLALQLERAASSDTMSQLQLGLRGHVRLSGCESIDIKPALLMAIAKAVSTSGCLELTAGSWPDNEAYGLAAR